MQLPKHISRQPEADFHDNIQASENMELLQKSDTAYISVS